MSTSWRLQMVFLTFLAVYIGFIVFNIKIMFTIQSAVGSKKYLALFHKAMLEMIQESLPVNQPSGHDRVQDLSLPEIYRHDINETMKKKWRLNHGRNVYIAPNLFHRNFTPGYILGKGRSKKVSIVIGIPSVRRPDGHTYLQDTLRSLVSSIYPIEEDDVAIVVFLAEEMDFRSYFVEAEARSIYSNFTREIDNGLIQIISPPYEFYPAFYNLPATLNEHIRRVEWRSKEVFDAAYLMFHCRNKGSYYLMLEDDLWATKGYISAINQFAQSHEETPYAYLSFCVFNSIGKLFRSSDIPSWVTYFFNFFWFKPIDWLMKDFLFIKACYPEMSWQRCEKRKELLKPVYHLGLFQHVGEYSSLRGKFVYSIDKTFSPVPVQNNSHRNPAAKVTTTFRTVDDSSAQSWYDDSGGTNEHFLIMPTMAGDHLTVEFSSMQTVTKILVKSGMLEIFELSLSKEKTLLENTTVLEYASRRFGTHSWFYQQCAVFDHNGEAECRFNSVQVGAVRMQVIKSNPSLAWLDLIYVQF